MKLLLLLTLLLLPTTLFLSCSSGPTDVAGGGSSQGNALTSGYIYNSDGTPAKHAKVRFVTVDHNPYAIGKRFAIADSVYTDSTGWYGTDDLPADTYNVFAEGVDDSLGYLDSVVFDGDTTEVPTDTLALPGTLRGFIKLQPGDDATKVIPIVMGSNRFTFVGAAKDFALTDMAGGTYHIKFFSTLDNYNNLDTILTVSSGQDILLVDSIEMPLKIPKVTGLIISYDTLKQIVTLSWNQGDLARVKGYNVYRQHIDSNDVKLNVQAITDTFYVDSTGVQDETYIYRVASVNLADEVGVKTAGDSVKIATFFIVDSIFTGYGTGGSGFHAVTDIAIARNGDIYITEGQNNRLQIFDKNMGLKRQFNFLDTLSYPVTIALDSSSIAYVLMMHGVSAALNYRTLVRIDSLCNAIDTLILDNQIFKLDIRGGNIFALTLGDSIVVLDLNGQYIRNWGGSGSSIGKYLSPNSIAISDLYQIFVSDEQNSRVQISDSLGNVDHTIDFPDWTDNVAFSNQNQTLYVIYGSRLIGTALRAYNSQYGLIAEYKYPYGQESTSMAISDDGSIYIAGYGSDKIIKLIPVF